MFSQSAVDTCDVFNPANPVVLSKALGPVMNRELGESDKQLPITSLTVH